MLRELIDTGSELSFVNQETADIAETQGIPSKTVETQVSLADGIRSRIQRAVKLPVNIRGRNWKHRFLIMPTLQTPVLIGVDLWVKLGMVLTPPTQSRTGIGTAATTSGLLPISSIEQQQLKVFLDKEFGKFEKINGPTDVIQHRIWVQTEVPIKQRYRPRNPAMQQIINPEVDKMLQEGIIEPSRSAWSSPIVIVRKKNGEHRFCIFSGG